MAAEVRWKNVWQVVSQGNLSQVCNYFETRNPNVNAREPITGYTPLHSAIQAQKIEVMELLLELKANVNAQTDPGVGKNTPLHVAILVSCSAAVQLLLDSGANITTKNQRGHAPLEFLKLFIELGEGNPERTKIGRILNLHLQTHGIQRVREVGKALERLDVRDPSSRVAKNPHALRGRAERDSSSEEEREHQPKSRGNIRELKAQLVKARREAEHANAQAIEAESLAAAKKQEESSARARLNAASAAYDQAGQRDSVARFTMSGPDYYFGPAAALGDAQHAYGEASGEFGVAQANAADAQKAAAAARQKATAANRGLQSAQQRYDDAGGAPTPPASPSPPPSPPPRSQRQSGLLRGLVVVGTSTRIDGRQTSDIIARGDDGEEEDSKPIRYLATTRLGDRAGQAREAWWDFQAKKWINSREMQALSRTYQVIDLNCDYQENTYYYFDRRGRRIAVNP